LACEVIASEPAATAAPPEGREGSVAGVVAVLGAASGALAGALLSGVAWLELQPAAKLKSTSALDNVRGMLLLHLLVVRSRCTAHPRSPSTMMSGVRVAHGQGRCKHGARVGAR